MKEKSQLKELVETIVIFSKAFNPELKHKLVGEIRLMKQSIKENITKSIKSYKFEELDALLEEEKELHRNLGPL